MAWRRPGNKRLSEPMMVSLPMHICVTRLQWVNDVMPIASELEMSAILLTYGVNSLKLSDAYIHQQTWSSLIQVMAFNLFGTKPLPKPMLAYCQLESYEQTVVKFDCNLSNFIEEKENVTWKTATILSPWINLKLGSGSIAIMQMGLIISGSWFYIKMSSYQYRKSHCGDKTVILLSYLHCEISYTGKKTSLYWMSLLCFIYIWWPVHTSSINIAHLD